MEIGKMTLNEAYPHLKSVALAYGLKLNRVKEKNFVITKKSLKERK
jgi:hypothetical protein